MVFSCHDCKWLANHVWGFQSELEWSGLLHERCPRCWSKVGLVTLSFSSVTDGNGARMCVCACSLARSWARSIMHSGSSRVRSSAVPTPTTVSCLPGIWIIPIIGTCNICPGKQFSLYVLILAATSLFLFASSTWWAPLFNLKVMCSRAPLWSYEKLSRERSASLIPPHGFSVLSVRS